MSLADPMAVPAWLGVSRETQERLKALLGRVARWNGAINLVAPASLQNGWERHVLDSAQLFDLAPVTSGLWADLGSGGGFPGLVLAALAAEKAPALTFVLVESDGRKAAFLDQAARDLALAVKVCRERAELLPGLRADVVTARAFAPLEHLCGHAARHLREGGAAIFPKGARHEAETAEAWRNWRFEQQIVPSRTDSKGAILVLRNIRHA